MMNLTEPRLDDLMARPSHYDEHGLHQLPLKDGTICIADSLKHDLKIIYPSAILQRTLKAAARRRGSSAPSLAEGIVN